LHYRTHVGQGNGMITYFAIENSPVTGRGFGSFFPTTELYNSYAPGDKRKELYINSYINNTGQTITTILKIKGKANVVEKHNLFPIPQREIDLNPKLQQNPGY
jgi:hypothetical protein